jgi:hypothetical protein
VSDDDKAELDEEDEDGDEEEGEERSTELVIPISANNRSTTTDGSLRARCDSAS